MTRALETVHLSKSFGAVKALRDVDFVVDAGSTHALLGQNGAGKSTLVKVLNGIYERGTFSGRILLSGAEVEFSSPADARRRGIGYVPQEIQVLENLTVAENVLVGQTGPRGSKLVSASELRVRASRLMERLGAALDPGAPMLSLSAAQRQLVMIARALVLEPSVLMLDEPTASLSSVEADRLFEVLLRLRTAGLTTVFITHRIAEVRQICDSATVLRDGAVAATFSRDQFDDREIVAAMVGRRLETVFPSREVPVAEPAEVLSVEHLTVSHPSGLADIVKDVTLGIHAGEIVGLAGLVGSGRTEILSAIYGTLRRTGTVRVANKVLPPNRPDLSRRSGLGMLTEDRKGHGLLFNFTLGRNITVGNLSGLARFGFVDTDSEERESSRYVSMLRIKTHSLGAAVDHVSGGNQQKALLARALMSEPRILLLDEPTKGVDVGTKQEIYRLLLKLADQGIGLLLVSSELDEVLGLADRCLVIAGGRVVDEFVKGEGDEHRVIYASTVVAGQKQGLEVS